MADVIEQLRKLAEWPDDCGPAFVNDVAERAATELEALRKRCEAVESLAPKYPDDGNGDDDAYNAGWNACLKAIAAAQEPSHG